jgi:hypothetical protein
MLESRQEAEARLNDNLLEAQVEAVLQGHDLGCLLPIDDDGLYWEAYCVYCGLPVRVNHEAIDSLLAPSCPGCYVEPGFDSGNGNMNGDWPLSEDGE